MASKVVFFTYAYPPLKAPRSIQIGRLVKYSSCPIRVVCCDNPSAPKDSTLIDVSGGKPPDLRVFPLRHYRPVDPRSWLSFLPFPDYFRRWVLDTARVLLKERFIGPDDVLVTFGHPMSDHLAGLKIKRAIGVPWIAHFSDPWCDNPFRHPLSRMFCRRMERAVISSADRVVFTSKESAELVMRKYPRHWAQKVAVVPHAYDPDLYPSEGSVGTEVIIRSLGTFYKRSPRVLLEALSILHRTRPKILAHLRIEIIGRMKDRADLRSLRCQPPPDLVKLRPPVDYLTSLKLMRESDLLLLINAPLERSVFLPSKLVDYLGANRPILGITPPGTSADVIREARQPVVNPKDPKALAEELADTIDHLRSSPVKTLEAPEVRERYAAPRVTAMMDALIREW